MNEPYNLNLFERVLDDLSLVLVLPYRRNECQILSQSKPRDAFGRIACTATLLNADAADMRLARVSLKGVTLCNDVNGSPTDHSDPSCFNHALLRSSTLLSLLER
jgi:hypothetical protein